MSEESKAPDEGTEESKSSREKVGDGFKQGVGVLSAFKDALEETILEARERGDLSTERAKEVMKEALDRAQTAAEGARERLDFVNQSDIDAMTAALDSVRGRLSALEESVFGASKGDEATTATDASAEDAQSEGGSAS